MAKKSKRNKKKIKRHPPDDIFRKGPLTVMRHGTVVTMRNDMTSEQHSAMKARAAQMLPEIMQKIDAAVQSLAGLVAESDPLALLQMCYGMRLHASFGKKTEPEYGFDDHVPGWTLEYVQNVLASTTPSVGPFVPLTEARYDAIAKEVEKIYREIVLTYFLAASAQREAEGLAKNPEYEAFYVQAQMDWVAVRKDRYTTHDAPHLRAFLSPHTEAFQKVYGISVDNFISELERIVASLTRGMSDAVRSFEDVEKEALRRFEEGEVESLETAIDGLTQDPAWQQKIASFQGRFLGTDLFDLEKVTSLPLALLEKMSWGLGEEQAFLASGMHSGWPLRRTPLRQRPFLKIQGRYYCFDYQPLVDGAYRFFQKNLTNALPEYAETWKERQQEQSERLPLDILSTLLGGAKSLCSVFYQWPPTNATDKNWCETDGLIAYDDHLIVVESKAGSFSYTSPADDFESHLKSLNALVEKPSAQARRFLEYLGSAQEVPIFSRKSDGTFQEACKLRRKDFRVVTCCGVTLDSFAYLASRAENLKALGVDLKGVPFWSISIGDLMVYQDIFSSPTTFAHFLEQRQLAIANPQFVTTDEMDHLGMYLKHNQYSTITNDFPEASHLTWNGYSASIDEYYYLLMADPEAATLPRQEKIPPILECIISFLDRSTTEGRAQLAARLLDMSGDLRAQLANIIDKTLKEQRADQRVKPTSLFHGNALSIVCEQPTATISVEKRDEYINANMVWAGEEQRLGLFLKFDDDDQLIDVAWKNYQLGDLQQEQIQVLREIADGYAANRIELYKRQTGQRKIGANEPCPCNSGKKFKRCHGRN